MTGIRIHESVVLRVTMERIDQFGQFAKQEFNSIL